MSEFLKTLRITGIAFIISCIFCIPVCLLCGATWVELTLGSLLAGLFAFVLMVVAWFSFNIMDRWGWFE